MRRAQLHQLVTDLIERTWSGDDADLADAILRDDAFGALCHHLQHASDGDAEAIERVWADLVATIDDATLDFLAEDADNPAAWLAHRTQEVSTGIHRTTAG